MAQTYEPKYLDGLSKVPLAGPEQDINEAEKLRVVEFSESKLESDVQDGSEIPQQQVENIHSEAVSAYSTFLLSLDPSHPTSVRAGDLPDGSRERSAFANEMLKVYNSAIDSITRADDDTGSIDHTIVTV